ncbi:MAG: hypothetical protein AB8G05_24285 [Oligoflexales bacterium]
MLRTFSVFWLMLCLSSVMSSCNNDKKSSDKQQTANSEKESIELPEENARLAYDPSEEELDLWFHC